MYGPLQRSKSYRQLARRSATYVPPLGRGPTSLILGSDAEDEVAVMQSGDGLHVQTTGDVNDTLRLAWRAAYRLNARPPVGYAWRIVFTVDTHEEEVLVTYTNFTEQLAPTVYTLDDMMVNVAGLGTINIACGLELIQDPDAPGPLATDVEVTLPTVWVDQILVPEAVPSDLYLSNRQPEPTQRSVYNEHPTLTFVLADVTGTGIDLTQTRVLVDSASVYLGGAFVAPWSGTVTPGYGPTGNDVQFVITVPAANLPYTSEQVVTVEVISELMGGAVSIDESWLFIAADVTAPAVQQAVMQSKRILRVIFTDDVQLDTATDGALNIANYTIERVSVPAASLNVIGAQLVPQRTDAVDLLLDTDASIGAQYILHAASLRDESGNTISSIGGSAPFLGFAPPRPLGRRFELLDFIADENLRLDRAPGTGDLRRFILVLQDVIDIMLSSIDEWTNIIDVDLAPEPFLDAILQDLGNPFASSITDLSVIDKRRLARVLISIYKQKGTTPGVINAIRFFLGVEVTLDIINYRDYWELGVSLLELESVLAPPVGSPLWYSFYVVSPIVLTDEQRARILSIAQYMKGAHEHVLGIIEPGTVISPSPYWLLNVSLLGSDPALNPSTIFA